MTEEKKKSSSHKRVTEKERFSYIGFDVFPKDPKELFDSDAEKEKLVAGVRARYERHDHLRESCTLLEERVSFTDRIAVTAGAVMVFAALFLPWYSAYNEIVEEVPTTQSAVDSAIPAENLEMAAADSIIGTVAAGTSEESLPVSGETLAADIPDDSTAAAGDSGAVYSAVEPINHGLDGELITSLRSKKTIHKEYSRLSGIGGIISIGSLGSFVFSSGISLILTAILFMLYTVLCVGLPAYTLYGLYGIKGNSDEKALILKKLLRYNWLLLILFVAGLILSFFGSGYSFDAAGVFTSLGNSYGIDAYLSVISPGVYVALAGSILCAAKGAEI